MSISIAMLNFVLRDTKINHSYDGALACFLSPKDVAYLTLDLLFTITLINIVHQCTFYVQGNYKEPVVIRFSGSW